MRTIANSAAMKQPARIGHPTQPANEGVRKDHVPIKINVNSSPSTFSHQGPCCAADMNEAERVRRQR